MKEVSVFLSGDEITMLDSKFPATRNYKSGCHNKCSFLDLSER